MPRLVKSWLPPGEIAPGVSARVRRNILRATERLRRIPIAAVMPIRLLVVGPGATMEMALIAFASLWPVLLTCQRDSWSLWALDDSAREVGARPEGGTARCRGVGSQASTLAGIRIAVATPVLPKMPASSAGLGHLGATAKAEPTSCGHGLGPSHRPVRLAAKVLRARQAPSPPLALGFAPTGTAA